MHLCCIIATLFWRQYLSGSLKNLVARTLLSRPESIAMSFGKTSLDSIGMQSGMYATMLCVRRRGSTINPKP